jgi:SAM-dependent methyltransferase
MLPADVYEGLIDHLVTPGCVWLDVGGGSDVFPSNPVLAQELAERAGYLVAVDPSANVHDNRYAHERVQCPLENYQTHRTFDLATLRMVAEHVTDPDQVVHALQRLVRPQGLVVVFTVNRLSPLALVSRAVPFRWHHPLKRLIWVGEAEDTFPVVYKMNSRATLARIFTAHGFHEHDFAYLDDLSTFGQFKIGSKLELLAWRLCRALGMRYPENCLLGVYQRDPE